MISRHAALVGDHGHPLASLASAVHHLPPPPSKLNRGGPGCRRESPLHLVVAGGKDQVAILAVMGDLRDRALRSALRKWHQKRRDPPLRQTALSNKEKKVVPGKGLTLQRKGTLPHGDLFRQGRH